MFGYLQITVPNLEAQVRYPEATNRKGVTLIISSANASKKVPKAFAVGYLPTLRGNGMVDEVVVFPSPSH